MFFGNLIIHNLVSNSRLKQQVIKIILKKKKKRKKERNCFDLNSRPARIIISRRTKLEPQAGKKKKKKKNERKKIK